MEGHDRGGSVALAWPPPPLPPPAPVATAPAPTAPRGAGVRVSIGSIALVVAVGLAFADASIVVLALPEIYGELHTTIVGVSWVITAYALVVGVGALLLAPFARRANPRMLVILGLALFAFASLSAGTAHETAGLMVARCLQGAGAALMLGASLPVLTALQGSAAAGRRLWAGAGVIGAVIGPAVGGLLTQVFDWRAIFYLQAPVAALALAGVFAERSRNRAPVDLASHLGGRIGWRAAWADLALAFVGAASVGALFLGVLLVVEVWRYEPLAGALVVSALPAATLVARRLGRVAPPMLLLGGGVALIGAGLVALALLPASSAWYLGAALAVFGAGLGFASDVLGPLSIPERGGGAAAHLSVSARHLGLVLGLVAIAPTLAANLESAADRATLAGTATVLDAQLSVREKVPLAWEIRNVLVKTPDGQVPDLDSAFTKRDVSGKPALAQVQTDLNAAIRDTLTRGFRSSFMIAAGLGVLALVPGLLALRGATAASARRRRGAMALVGLVAVGGGLIAMEVGAGASDFGRTELVDPCTAPPSPYDGSGLDGAVQRIALGGLNGAACDLGVSREELVLSLDPHSRVADVKWDHDTIDDAVKAGTLRAIDDAHDRGTLPGWASTALETVVKHAPISWFLDNVPFDKIPFLN
jgi:MFS family permease